MTKLGRLDWTELLGMGITRRNGVVVLGRLIFWIVLQNWHRACVWNVEKKGLRVRELNR